MILRLILLTMLISSTVHAGWRPIGPYGGVVLSMTATGDGIYAGTEGGGVFFSSDGGKNWIGRSSGLNNLFVESLAAGKDGSTYAGTREGVFKSIGGKVWEKIPAIPSGASVKSIAVDNEGNLSASLWGSGVYTCKGEVECVNPRGNLSSLLVNGMSTTKEGDLLISTEGGVYRLKKGSERWDLLGMLEFMLPSLAFDKEGTLYAATWGSGVHYYAPPEWNYRSFGISSSMVAVLRLGPDENLYAGTEGGVSILPFGKSDWTAIGPENTYVKSLGFGNKGEVYAGTYGRGFMSKEKDKEWERRNTGIYNTHVISMSVSDKGEVFAGTKQGLYTSWKGKGEWTEVQNLFGIKVTSFLIDGDKVYAGTSNGLFLREKAGKDWKRVDGDVGYMPITSIARSGRYIFAGTDSDGIYRSSEKGTDWKLFNQDLENMRITSLITVDDGNVYAGTFGGIWALQKGQDKWISMGMNDSIVLSVTYGKGMIHAAVENKGIFSFLLGRWAKVEGELPNNRLLFVHHDGKKLYACGYGWIAYKDGDAPWKNMSENVASTIVQTMTSDSEGKLYAGTWGSGMWVME